MSVVRPVIIVSSCCGTELTYVQILRALIMSVVIPQVYTVAIFINAVYEQCSYLDVILRFFSMRTFTAAVLVC